MLFLQCLYCIPSKEIARIPVYAVVAADYSKETLDNAVQTKTRPPEVSTPPTLSASVERHVPA